MKHEPYYSRFNQSDEINIFFELIFNLVNLSYCDRDCSEAEVEVIRILADKWGVSSNLLNECFDTEETILMLNCQIDWLRHTSLPSNEKKKRIETVQKKIQSMENNMLTTLREATVLAGKGN